MNQELQNYINQERKQGTTDEVIKQRLRDNGWQDDMFKDYFFTDASSQQEPYLPEYSRDTKNHNILILIILGAMIILAGGAYFAYAQGYFNFSTTPQEEKTIVEEDNDLVVEDDSMAIDKQENIRKEDIEDWGIYKSDKGFSFSYPKDFIKDQFSNSSDDGFSVLGVDFYSAEDNTDFVYFTKPKECSDAKNKFFDFLSNGATYTVEEQNSIEEYLESGKCMSISVEKTEFNPYDNIFNETTDAPEEGENYLFAGISGNLVTSIIGDEGSNFTFVLTGESGDYVFEIDISGNGFTKDEVFQTFEGVAKSFKIDKSLTIKPDPFADTDGDGLNDSEERLHGTDINIADTDGDGNLDGEEVNNCYNPNGAGLMTVEHFQNYCVQSIASEILISRRMFEIREELCTLWQPIAKDFINKDIQSVPSGYLSDYEIFLYDNIYNDYPEMCNQVDSLAEEEFCEYIFKYLSEMCPRRNID